jgi:translation initiation factor 6
MKENSERLILRLASVQKSPFIGAYAAVGGSRGIIYPSSPKSFETILEKELKLEVRRTTVGMVSAVGMMTAFNGRTAVVPRTINDEEACIFNELGLEVFRVPSNMLAWGNLMATNDRGAVFSGVVPRHVARVIAEALDVDYDFVTPKGYAVSGSSIATSNRWALVSKSFSEDQVARIEDILKVKAAVVTVNGGYKQVKVGALVSDFGILLGKSTTGVELFELQSALA